jgi:hypothetical protein|tara:strand:+ start:2272 stop:2481 length:210 start_codon:yes stop_codon:yes gene_type:complete
MKNKTDLPYILAMTSCDNLHELSVKTGLHYQNLYRVLVLKDGNLQAKSMIKVIDASLGKLSLTDLYKLN